MTKEEAADILEECLSLVENPVLDEAFGVAIEALISQEIRERNEELATELERRMRGNEKGGKIDIGFVFAREIIKALRRDDHGPCNK